MKYTHADSNRATGQCSHGYGGSHTDADTAAHTNTRSDCYAYGYSFGPYADGDLSGDAHGYSYGDHGRYAGARCNVYTHTNTNAHAACSG